MWGLAKDAGKKTAPLEQPEGQGVEGGEGEGGAFLLLFV